MSKSLSVLYVAAEAFPFAKETSVADVAGGLPIALHELGHDIRMMIPRYGCMSDRKHKIYGINRMSEATIEMPNGKQEPMTIKSSSIMNTRTKVQVYAVCNSKYFESKKGIYHDPIKWIEYTDNLERFAYFSRAVVEACACLGWYPNIIHCNDWQTALIPALIKYYYANKFKKTKTILTVHNVSSQGVFPESMFDVLGLPEESKDAFLHKKQINILKGGMAYANKVTTVSQAYKEQISKDKDHTNGLHTLIKSNYDKIESINNGIDANCWNPQKDTFIHKKLEDDIADFKTMNKMAVCDAYKLEYDKDTPLISMIGRLDLRKGIDIIIEALPKLMQQNIQLIIVGQGEKSIKDKLNKLSKQYPKKLVNIFTYDDALAHQIEAGSDMFLMPSRQEASGLNLLYSLAYGAIPIVNLTGGIKDNAIPLKKNNIAEANCFEVKPLTPEKLSDTMAQAIELYSQQDIWNELVSNVMAFDYTWFAPAQKYNDLYKRLYKDEDI